MASLTIDNISEDQIIRISKILNESTRVNIIVKNYPESVNLHYEKVVKRRAFVYSTLLNVGVYRLESLFQLVRKKGYARNRKTFTRDIIYLQLSGKLEKKVINGGVNGSHTMLKPINSLQKHQS